METLIPVKVFKVSQVQREFSGDKIKTPYGIRRKVKLKAEVEMKEGGREWLAQNYASE